MYVCMYVSKYVAMYACIPMDMYASQYKKKVALQLKEFDFNKR